MLDMDYFLKKLWKTRNKNLNLTFKIWRSTVGNVIFKVMNENMGND